MEVPYGFREVGGSVPERGPVLLGKNALICAVRVAFEAGARKKNGVLSARFFGSFFEGLICASCAPRPERPVFFCETAGDALHVLENQTRRFASSDSSVGLTHGQLLEIGR